MPERVESNTELTPKQTEQAEGALEQVHGEKQEVVPAGTGFAELVKTSVEGPINISAAFFEDDKDVGEEVKKYGEDLMESSKHFIEGATNQVMVD